MDEPFGALDPITRESLQNEFLEIQEEINTTILFVTHSIDEALKMGDRIAIFDVGELVQYDTPQAILEEPKSEFVEDFIGADRTLKELQVIQAGDLMVPVDGYEGIVDTIGKSMNGSEEIVPVSPTDSTQVALSRMIQADIEAIPVVDDGEVLGVVTEAGIRDRREEETDGGERRPQSKATSPGEV